MREDELATHVVEHLQARDEATTIHLEEPFDHYSNRGVVDVYAQVSTPPPVEYVVELKADAALRHASGANEILRQYRRMERYFYEDDQHRLRRKLARTGPAAHFLLLFAPTPRCVEHVAEHRSLYGSIDPATDVEGVPATRKVAFLVNLEEAATGDLGFLSVNGDVTFGSETFRSAVPASSRLADALEAATGVDW